MDEADRLRQALKDLLRELRAGPEKPIDLYEIGVPLVRLGFTQHGIVDLLLSLERQGVIGRIENNELSLMTPVWLVGDGNSADRNHYR